MVKATMKLIVASNGAEVLVCQNTTYRHTELDKIILAYKEQEHARRKLDAKNKMSITNTLKFIMKRR